MRKLFILTTVICLVYFTVNAQTNNEAFFLYKSDWTPARNWDKADYFMHAIQVNDSTYCCRYYAKNGPMIRQECYKDQKFTIPNGLFAWYNRSGKIDSSGNMHGQLKDGLWSYYDGDLNEVTEKDYSDGVLLETRDNVAKKIYYADGRIASTDSTEITQAGGFQAAQCKDGPVAWAHYIATNLHIPDRFLKLGNSGTVVVKFDVDPSGNIDSLVIAQSIEWSADAEAIRVITTGPHWQPATQDGKPVRYTQKQSIGMRVN